jgi:hypothetical protein
MNMNILIVDLEEKLNLSIQEIINILVIIEKFQKK